MSIDRRRFLQACSALGLSHTLFPGALYATVSDGRGETPDDRDGPSLRRTDADGDRAPGSSISPSQVEAAAAIAGLEFTTEEREMIAEDLTEALAGYETLREIGLPNRRVPCTMFDPNVTGRSPTGATTVRVPEPSVQRPARDVDLAFADLPTLATLLKTRQVTAVELTELFLGRLRHYDDTLQAVITYTEDRAMEAARAADRAFEAGEVRSMLQGIPYGAKDLLAMEGYPTTWGAEPYKAQVIDETATVIQNLDAAGAVCIAKLSLGALAWGDVWYGGTTKNPWNVEQGSSGSSAGPGAAVAAGCVPFAIGSETLGSIVSPSTRNGVTGHRPTFGTVSRHGAMTLSWTMDKLGPMARSALDCAIVYAAIRGADERDPVSTDAPFDFDTSSDLSMLNVGVLQSAFEADYPGADADRTAVKVLNTITGGMQPFDWPESPPVGPMLKMLEVEAAAAFDDLTRSGLDDTMVRQERNAWPHVFRAARMVPAVEFLQMSRHRRRLMEETARVMEPFDVVITPSYQGGTLGLTNLTGHPCVCVPNEFATVDDAPQGSPKRQPRSFTFIGDLYRDDATLRLAHAYQMNTDFHTRRPPMQ